MSWCFKQKTAYVMRIRYWSSDVCSSDLFVQSIDDPSSSSLLAFTYPADVLCRVFSVQQVSTFVGAGLGVGLGGLLGGAFGWQWAFAIVGVPGSLIALAVFRMKEPGDRKSTRLNSSH